VRDVLVVAGEASGDLHGSGLARAIRERRPDVRMLGLGGPRMATAGVELLEHGDHMAVMGFVEVLRKIPHHYAMLRQIETRLRSGAIGLVILIDYPGFNMKVAAAARRAGIPVLYYITPQVWAWGANRLERLSALITKAAVILPFEEALLRKHGIDATFVGHPLLDRAGAMPDRAGARSSLGIDATAPMLALFPGSRAQEIARHLAPFVETARLMRETNPQLQVFVSAAPDLRIDPGSCPFPIVTGASFAVLRAADVALCKSGTTTLEAAVAGCPLAVAYRTSAWTYAIARRVVRIPDIGLVNVVAGRTIAKEFVQGALVPRDVADHLERLLMDRPERAALIAALAEVREKLGTPGAAGRVATMALGLLA
jgi:lipid-A-disaccharide synthase